MHARLGSCQCFIGQGVLLQEELLARLAGLAAADGFTVHARARRTGSPAAPPAAFRFRYVRACSGVVLIQTGLKHHAP